MVFFESYMCFFSSTEKPYFEKSDCFSPLENPDWQAVFHPKS
jgi:hypothetical protein